MTLNANNETIIDFEKEFKKIIDNKKTKKIIFICFLICMSLGILLNFILPKKYTSEAKLLIKTTVSTNLSDINPYTLSETSENNNSDTSTIKNSLNEEIEIIKSPLVLDKTIKENNLKYENGPAKGKYLSTKDFSRKDFDISKIKDANIIYISYKSKSPVLAYNIVNSIINNYKKIQENLNLKKSSNDNNFLKKASLKAEKELNSKINQLKKYNDQPQSLTDNSSMSNINLFSFYDKRFKQKIKQISNNAINSKKIEIEIAQKTEELNTLKKKLEWSSMVKEISGNSTNMVILQSPEIKEKYDFSEPQPIIIFILSLFSWIFMCFVAISFKKNA